jgi:hypothetical protein
MTNFTDLRTPFVQTGGGHFRTIFAKKKNDKFTVWKTFHDLDLDSHNSAFFPRPLPKENFSISLLLF